MDATTITVAFEAGRARAAEYVATYGRPRALADVPFSARHRICTTWFAADCPGGTDVVFDLYLSALVAQAQVE